MDIQGIKDIGTAEANIAHDYRIEATVNSVFGDKNEFWYPPEIEHLPESQRAGEMIARQRRLIQEIETNYREINNQRIKDTTSRLQEIFLEINEDTTGQDIYESYGKYFEGFGVTITGIALHKDEGMLEEIAEPHRKLISGVQFERGGDGKFYYLVYSEKSGNYERNGKIVDETKFKRVYNYHAHILFTNFRSDGTAITKPCRADRQYIKQLEKEAKAKGKKFNLNTLIKEGKFKPSVEIMNQNFFKEFANSWQDIYNKKFPHKKPLFKKEKTEDSEDFGRCYDEALHKIADIIIAGTFDKSRLSENVKQFLEYPLKTKRIPGHKYLGPGLDDLANPNSKPKGKREIASLISKMKQSGTDARLAQMILDKLANIAQMSQNELEKLKKEREKNNNKGVIDKIANFFKPLEVENPNFDPKDAEIKALKNENTELKAELDTAKAEIKGQINEKLDKNSQKHTALKEVSLSFDEITIYSRNKEIVAQAKDALTSFKTAEMISALKALRKQNMELEDILKKRALRDYADLKARSGSKIAEGSKTTQTLTKTEKRAENCPKSSDFFENISILKPKN